jgi:hypothetical protein
MIIAEGDKVPMQPHCWLTAEVAANIPMGAKEGKQSLPQRWGSISGVPPSPS